MSEMIEITVGTPEPGRSHLVEENEQFAKWWEQFGSPDMLAIYKQFGIGSFRRSTALLGLDRFIRENKFTGKRCIEIGTAKGLTAIILSRHFEEVISFDILPDADKHRFAEFCGVKNVRFIDATDNVEKARLIGAFDGFDAAYVDGNHSDDSESDFNLVRKCGHILFHEYWPLQPPVWSLVNNLRKAGTVTTFDNFALWIETSGSSDQAF